MIGRSGRGLALCKLEISWCLMSTKHYSDDSYRMGFLEQTKVLKRVAVAPLMGDRWLPDQQERQQNNSLHGATRSKQSK